MPAKKTNPPIPGPATKTAPVISLKNVEKHYKVGKNDIHVLKKINVEIFPGEFVIILGPSGSGKSTLLNHLLGLELPTSGQVIIHGHDITNMSANKISKLRYQYFGIIFQRPDWVGSINVLQNILLPLAIHNVKQKVRVEKAWKNLKDVDMTDHATFNPLDLSGGQQQKAALARALVNDPDVIIADEPTGNLDTVSADKVMETFKQLNQLQHKTVIMVTHNIDYIRYGSRTIYIRDGAVVDSSQHFTERKPT